MKRLAVWSCAFLAVAAAEEARAQYSEVTPAGSAVTASTHDGNVPGNTVDNNLGTRWSANGDGQWLQLDLGTTRTVGYVRVALYQGNTRRSRFDLQVSTGGGVWATAWSGESSGTTTAEETFDFTDVAARYVRYMGHGNSANAWNSVSEVSIFATTGTGPTPTPAPTATPGSRVTPTPAPTSTPSGSNTDRFGVRKIYATKSGGREWTLPDNATQSDGRGWSGSGISSTGTAGVFHVSGSPRIAVMSPSGFTWWRNVEITAYYRLTQALPQDGPPRGWQLYARGGPHITSQSCATCFNGGVRAPSGTPTWPNYPWGDGQINGHCLGSSYKGYMDLAGTMQFKKEISHAGGYTGGLAKSQVWPGQIPTGKWFGFKTIIRNYSNNTNVHMESYIDMDANGNWVKKADLNDTGNWNAGSSTLDGCTAAPFSYRQNTKITWAGPYVNFRADSLSFDFRWLSAREIDALP
jgi:hypothetical protein